MELEFTTEINGKPTLFIDKIWQSIVFLKHVSINDYLHYRQLYRSIFGSHWDAEDSPTPKRHTIREDKRNRWRAGVMIDYCIKVRTKNMFCFAPKVKVKSIQTIEIQYYSNMETMIKDLPQRKRVLIDSRILTDDEVDVLAKNDGFDSTDDFFAYFDKDFTGKIIHWTDLKY